MNAKSPVAKLKLFHINLIAVAFLYSETFEQKHPLNERKNGRSPKK